MKRKTLTKYWFARVYFILFVVWGGIEHSLTIIWISINYILKKNCCRQIVAEGEGTLCNIYTICTSISINEENIISVYTSLFFITSFWLQFLFSRRNSIWFYQNIIKKRQEILSVQIVYIAWVLIAHILSTK